MIKIPHKSDELGSEVQSLNSLFEETRFSSASRTLGKLMFFGEHSSIARGDPKTLFKRSERSKEGYVRNGAAPFPHFHCYPVTGVAGSDSGPF